MRSNEQPDGKPSDPMAGKIGLRQANSRGAFGKFCANVSGRREAV
ncbi:regulatory protein [Neisseria bacilliformis ATCC BAA-1200]|uniref:Regulatory protein n=1 Tax=Neisseria bacilliformis ATCC BAA-1200 TaxID=888742 RepID=F2BAP6_9NEIS|nr:regulatory protein [Neisseria bacilliformis ATCC BAA-1200]